MGAIHAAAQGGHLNIVKLLVEEGGKRMVHSKKNNGETPLYVASANGRDRVVR